MTMTTKMVFTVEVDRDDSLVEEMLADLRDAFICVAELVNFGAEMATSSTIEVT